ncbi:MAG: ATP-binding cassette domain-containing protein [Fervidobacterium sp.]|nr:ATP-binding cassette domain-containing protein [Fervidobacterium sp.]
MDELAQKYVISVEGLSKRFGGKQVLSNISFTVEQGSIFALIGPNGAGKTTTIRCIMDSIENDGGEIELFGQSIDPAIKRNIAVVSEDRRVFRHFTALDYEALWSALYPKWDSDVFKDFLAKYNFDLKQRVETYSIGMKTLFFVALAVSSQAELLILDEPTQHLDPTIRFDIMTMLKSYAKEGRTILISSHEIFEIEEYATHFAIIKQGKVIYTDSIDDAKEKHRIISEGDLMSREGVVGIVGNEVLIKIENAESGGRYPRLNEIVVGYLTGTKR